jgi:hypothetical protein
MLVSVLPLIVFGFLTNTLVGILVLAIAAYWLAPAVGIQPSFAVLADLIGSLEPDTLLTIVGLFAAYFLALVTWRRQKILELRLTAGSEIRDFFQQGADHALTLFGFAESLIQASGAAERGQLESERWRLLVLRRKIGQAMVSRDELTKLGRNVYSLTNKVALLTNSSFFAQRALPKAAETLSRLSVLAQFYIPNLDGADDYTRSMLVGYNTEGVHRYIDEFHKLHMDMLTHSNAVYGVFQQPIMIPNLALLWSQMKMIWKVKSISANDLH